MEPDFIFEVEYSDTNAHNAKFNELSQSWEVWYAYHGSRVDNFHSILHNGLHAHLNKVLVVVEIFIIIAGLQITAGQRSKIGFVRSNP